MKANLSFRSFISLTAIEIISLFHCSFSNLLWVWNKQAKRFRTHSLWRTKNWPSLLIVWRQKNRSATGFTLPPFSPLNVKLFVNFPDSSFQLWILVLPLWSESSFDVSLYGWWIISLFGWLYSSDTVQIVFIFWHFEDVLVLSST